MSVMRTAGVQPTQACCGRTEVGLISSHGLYTLTSSREGLNHPLNLWNSSAEPKYLGRGRDMVYHKSTGIAIKHLCIHAHQMMYGFSAIGARYG